MSFTAPPQCTDVFVEHTGGYFAYRIPAIETAPDGSLLAFSEAQVFPLGNDHTLLDPGPQVLGQDRLQLVARVGY